MDQANVSGLLSVGMHEMDGVEESYAAEYTEMNQDTSQGTTKFDIVMASSAMYTDHINTDSCLDGYHMSGIQPLEEIRFGSEEHFKPHSEAMVADSEEENNSSSPDTSSATNYDTPGYMDQDLQHIYNAYDAMVDKEGLVFLSPAFIICGETSHLEPHLTFSSDGIKIEYLDLDSFDEDEKMVSLQWEISNIISISCKWSQSVGAAFITLLAGSEAETGNLEPVTVQFCLDDSQWPRKQQKIWDIGARYQEIWKDIPSDDFASGNWSIEPSLFFPRQYFSSTLDFEDVIYPKGDPDAVSISKRDAELLLPETFVNDTIIDFYVKYLSMRIESSEKHRYHFFNSFFFRKLADLDKDQGRAPEGRAAFLRVRKWTRKINVFEKDFLFIPVNFSLHWSLIVICYPGEVATFEDGETKVSAKVPCILHMDSLKGSHTGLKDIIQSYLWEEWKERHPESASDNSDKFLNLRFVSLELPQQDNSFDCGLFLLHYVELFLMDAPSNFNPLKIDVFSGFLSDDWFAPAEASLKRSVVWKLIHELVTGSFPNHPKLACRSEQLDERNQRCSNAEREPAEERCSAGEPESACTIHDGTHEIQPSTSVCLNDPKEKGPPSSGCMLEAGTVSLVDVQSLQESAACAPDKDTVFFSTQDEKNEPLLAQSNDIAGQEHSLHRTAEVGDECFRPPQDLDSDMMLDSRKDDIGPHPERATTKGDCGDPCEDKDSVRLGDVNKDVTGTKCEVSFVDPMTAGNAILQNANEISMTKDSLVDPMTAETAIIENAKEISTTKDLADPMTTDNAIIENAKEISTTEDSLVDPMTAENATMKIVKEISTTEDNLACPMPAENAIIENVKEISTMDPKTVENAIIKNVKEISMTEDSLVDPMTAENAIIENVEKISTTDPRTVGNNIIENGKDISMSADNVTHSEQYVSSELHEENADSDVTGDCSELKEGNRDNGMAGGGTVSSDINEENIDKVTAGDCTNETVITANDDNLGLNVGNTDSCMTGSNTVSSDLNEGNADHIVTGDCQNETNVNDEVDKSLPPGGAVTCEDDTTCSDATIASADGTCSTKNDPVFKNTSSDGKRAVPEGSCEEGIDTPGEKCIQRDDAQGIDAKIERHYKRRKVLAKNNDGASREGDH